MNLSSRVRRTVSAAVAFAILAVSVGGFALQVWVVPYLRRMAQKRAQAEEELRQQLGRKPTEDEVFAHLGIGGTRRT